MTRSAKRDNAKRGSKLAKRELDKGLKRSKEDGEYNAKLERVVDPERLKAEIRGYRSRERR